MSEYNEYPLYRQEVIRLNEFIKNLTFELEHKYNLNNILIPFIIGSSMEDSLANSHTTIENIFQYSQLFPNYINNFIGQTSNKKFIQIIIISPDKIFSTNHVPYFLLYEPYPFINTCPNEYSYLNEFIEIKINIFNCPVPCIESRNNLILNYQSMIDGLNSNHYHIDSYEQNNTDINFINNFYFNLDKLFNLSVLNQKIKIIINSWVSFKNLYGYSENYKMFPNLLKLANKYNIIATEWNFIDNLKFTKIISNYKIENINFIGSYINYVDNGLPELEHNIGNNLFLIDFTSKYYLKKIS